MLSSKTIEKIKEEIATKVRRRVETGVAHRGRRFLGVLALFYSLSGYVDGYLHLCFMHFSTWALFHSTEE